MKRVVAGLSLALLSVFFVTSTVRAFDGEVNLTNRVNDESRCWAATVLMQDQTYKILLSCRDITYPGGNSVFYYVVWANPASGGKAIRLGSLGLGKAEFQTKTEFNSLFITKEPSANAQTPTGAIIMQGTLKTVPILEQRAANTNPNTPTATVTPEPNEVVMTPIPTTQPRTGIAKFLTTGIVGILGVAGLIFVVFIITKR